MKRAKIMLMTIAVIATVGSALAFKANKLGSTTYCYLASQTQPASGGCTNIITDAVAQATGTTKYYYVAKPANVNCNSSSLACPNVAFSFAD